MSKYEDYIEQILEKNHIKYEREKNFKDLKNGKLRVDFFLLEYNIGIEVDGEQHTHYIKYFHKTRQDFLHQQENDRRKNSYFLANNIPLYRIPYNEVYSLKNINDLFKDKYLVRTRWHNDKL